MIETIIGVVGSAALFLMGWILATIYKLNATMESIKEWMDGHENIDNERHKDNLRRLDGIEQFMNQGRSGWWRLGSKGSDNAE